MQKKNISKDWLTPFEKSNQLESPDYENTLKYFQKFADKTPFVKIKSIGLTPQGRELKVKMLVCFCSGKFSSQKKSSIF
jgi:hypothetical protein